MNVFIVEDEAMVQAGYRAMLSGKDHKIIGMAADGQEAVDLFKTLADHVDLAIVDINIPTFDGITVVEKINELRKIPCIIVTAYCDDDLIARANKAGVYGYLQKPIDRYDLISAIGVASERFKEFSRLQMETDKAIKALEDRKLVDRAKGILMDRFGLKEADAMKALQKKARDNNLKLAEAAKGIIIAERML